MDLVVVDLAGTTIRDEAQVGPALRRGLGEHGIDVTDGEIDRLRGMSKREAIGPDHVSRRDAAFATFRTHLQAAYRDRPPALIAGTRETLEHLHSRGIRVALTTGFSRDIVEEILRTSNWPSDLSLLW